MNRSSKQVLIAAFADPTASPRPRRMLERSLSTGAKVSLFCLQTSTELKLQNKYIIHKNSSRWKWRRKFAAVFIGVGFHLLRTKQLRTRLINMAYGLNHCQQPFIGKQYKLVIIEDLFLIPYCMHHAEDTPIIFDAREFYTRQREGEILFELLERPVRDWLCRTYLPECAKIFTVSPGLSKAYKEAFGVDSEVLRSTPNYVGTEQQQDNTPSMPIRIVHLGVANSNRKIENMIEIFRRLRPGFTFDIYLSGNKPYVSNLKRLAAGIAGVRICEPVAPEMIIATLSKYDISFCYFEPTTFNLLHCLPNKFFESIQARIALAVGPSPDMAEIVKEFCCGFVSESFQIESMVKTLNELDTETLQSAKRGSARAAKELCSEKEWDKVDKYLQALCS